MTTTPVFLQVRKGMKVKTSDGVRVGTVKEVWYGTDPANSTTLCDEDVCSRLEVHQGWLRKRVLYVPYSAVADVFGTDVILNVDAVAAKEKRWDRRPGWLPVDITVVGPSGGSNF